MKAQTTEPAQSKQLVAKKDFRDAGTERSFQKGKPITDVDAGTLANYEAADLVGEPDAQPETTGA